MSFQQPPQILRIKRKRGQDPLQALILEERRPAKRSKPSSPVSSTTISRAQTPVSEPSNIYFALTRTDESSNIDESAIQSILSEASKPDGNDVTNIRKRKFVIPKTQTEEDTYIPNELSDMVNSFLNVNEADQPKRKRRTRGGGVTNTESKPANEALQPSGDDSSEDPLSDYVYDVYQISSEPLTNENHPQSQIGYIRFFDDDENGLYQSDDDDDPTRKIYSDDEDSNAESFYQNDYPSDEDAGVLSETYSSEDENLGPVIIERPEDADGVDYLKGGGDEIGEENLEDLYGEFFDDEDSLDVNFLPDDHGGEEHYKRQNFFPGEEEDEMAIHRDKIFGRLQRMIDEEP